MGVSRAPSLAPGTDAQVGMSCSLNQAAPAPIPGVLLCFPSALCMAQLSQLLQGDLLESAQLREVGWAAQQWVTEAHLGWHQ